MYRALAIHIATHPRRIIGGWVIVVIITATLALWGFGTPLYDRLHSDLPQAQDAQSYHGNKILNDAHAGTYTIVAGLNHLSLGDDLAAAQQARADLEAQRARAKAEKDTAERAAAAARRFAERAVAEANPQLGAESRRWAAQAREAGERAEQAGAAAKKAADVELPTVQGLADAVGPKLSAIEKQDGVTSVVAPFFPDRALLDEAATDLVNPSGTRAAIIVTLDADEGDGTVGPRGQRRIAAVEDALTALEPDLKAVAGADATVSLNHQRLIESTSISQLKRDLVIAESVGIPVSILIMVLVFGGVLAALMPAAGALVAVSSALAVMLGMTYLADQQSFAVNVISVLGLGLSIDYGLLILSRYREELGRAQATSDPTHQHRGIPEASRRYLLPLELTLASAGRTVFFSAVTVAVSILGMLVFTPNLLRSLGISGVTVVVLAAACALTLVPALAFLASNRLSRPPRTRLGRLLAPQAVRNCDLAAARWRRLGRLVNRHPWPFLVGSVAVLIVCVIPVGHLQLRNSMIELLAFSNPQRVMIETFSDVEAINLAPIEVVADTPDTEVLRAWGKTIESLPGVSQVGEPHKVGDHYTRMSIQTPGDDRGAPEAEALVTTLRAHPPIGASIWVTGQAAQQLDFVAALWRGLPGALAVIICATLILLFALTRSIIVPIKALLINSLSLVAALGISTWVFQDGWGVHLLGAEKLGGLESYVVVMMLCIGFGLSMDYEVFLLARMRETYVATRDNDRAVVTGLAHSGRIITSAAGILVCVFLAFCLSSMIALKQVGFVMAVAVALDATIVRLCLVPSLMTLFGNLNWWAPRWMRGSTTGEQRLAHAAATHGAEQASAPDAG